MNTRENVKATAKRLGMRLHTYEVRFAGSWWRHPPVICEAHTVNAAMMIAEAEHPGMWLGQVVVVG